MKKIVIIGGGAAGMTAAIAAAQNSRKMNQDVRIWIFEHKELVGKKILSTGNGRCNLTNEVMSPDCYYSEHPKIVGQILEKFGREDALRFFRELGIFVKSKNGYYYPRSEQALAVRELFQMHLENLGVKICTGVHVTAIKREKSAYIIHAAPNFSVKETASFKKKTSSKEKPSSAETADITIKADKVILTCGGMAAPVLGSDGSGYTLARSLGHSLVPVVPALVQLRVLDNPLKRAAGVRTDVTVSIYENNKFMGADTGELQITEYGISGIPVFQVSRHAAKALYYKRPVRAEIDFLPEIPLETMTALLRFRRKKQDKTCISEAMLGLFNKKLIPCLLKNAGIKPQLKICELSESQLHNFVRTCRNFPLTISDTNGFEHAQVCAGGVKLSEINASTMESLCCSGLYLAGEILDADGICGGYNLQWAWATGYLAGLNAVSDNSKI